MFQQGAPCRAGIVGPTPSYVAPPQGCQSHSYVAPPQGSHNSCTPPAHANVAVESFPQVTMPPQCHGPPHALRRGMSPPPSVSPAHVGMASQHTVSRGRLHDGRLQSQAEAQALHPQPPRAHVSSRMPEHTTRPAAVSECHVPPSGTSSSGGHEDNLQQEFREQQRHHARTPAKSPVQDSREARANPKSLSQHPERMRSARGSYGHEVAQLQSQLSDARAKIEELQGQVTRFEAELKEKKQERRDLKERERRSTERAEELTEREARVAEREDQCATRHEQLYSQQAERD